MRHARLAVVFAATVFLAAVGSADAKDDIGDLTNSLHGSGDVTARIALVQRLGASGAERAAQVLCKTALRDGDARVRVAAAEALVKMDSDVTYPSLKELLTEGGIREVRRQAAIGMSARPKGLEWTVRRIASSDTDKVERVLLVSSLGDFPALEAAAAIEELIGSEPAAASAKPRVRSGAAEVVRFVGRDYPPLRSAALRALARHRFGKLELPRVVVDVLTNAEDAETLLAALDVCDGVLDREIRETLPRLFERGDPRVTAAVECVSKRLDYLDAMDRYKERLKQDAKAKDEGYAVAPNPPPMPTAPLTRPRVDVVFICDSTGSMSHGKVQGVRGLGLAAQEELDTNVSYRHAFVSMQDTMREAWDPPSVYFPPLFDSSLLADVRWRQPSVGVDTQGIEVGVVLRDTLDRFDWRPGAERRVIVGSDTYIGDLELAKRTVRVHRQADGLTLRCPYVGYGIKRNAKSWTELAEAAGAVVPAGGK